MNIKMPKIKLPVIKMPVKLTRLMGRTQLALKSHGSEIALGMGLAGMAGTVVLACRATAKMPDMVSEHEEIMQNLHEMENSLGQMRMTEEDDGSVHEEEITEIDIRKYKAQVYGLIIKDYALTYAPAVALGMASAGSLIYGHSLEHRKYVGAMEAYTGALSLLDAYHQRVKDKYGDDIANELRYGLKHEKVETEVTDEKGKTKKKKEDILAVDVDNDVHLYERVFDPRNKYYESDPYFNKVFLEGQRLRFQQILDTRGHVFLNEVYDALGFEQTAVGAFVGWKQNPEDQPMNIISFGDFSSDNPMMRAFLSRKTDALLLDFNVDGVIVDKIEPKKVS